METGFRDAPFQVVCIKLDTTDENYNEVEYLLNVIRNESEAFFSARGITHIADTISRSNLVYIINDCTNQALYTEFFDCTVRIIDKFRGFSITFGIGHSVTSISELRFAITSALECVQCRIACGVNRILVHDTMSWSAVALEDCIPADINHRLQNIMESFDWFGFCRYLDDCMHSLHKIKNASPVLLFILLEYIDKTMQNLCAHSESDARLYQHAHEEMQSLVDTKISEVGLIEGCKCIVRNFITETEELRTRENRQPVRAAKKFIDDHFQEQITLDDAAQIAHLSPAYLSMVFKKESGIGFNDYLITCRIDAAKNILRTTGDTIVAVSRKVGYSDPKYFSKLFAKTVGLKPSTYRRLYS